MITREEAHQRAIKSEEFLTNLINTINLDIESASNKGEFTYSRSFNITTNKALLERIKNNFKSRGFSCDIEVVRARGFDDYKDETKYQLQINWK